MQTALHTPGVSFRAPAVNSIQTRLPSPRAPARQSRARATQGTQTARGTDKSPGEATSSSQNGKEQQPDANQASTSSRAGATQEQQDDDSRYPSKDWTAGGWAGGETGLRQFLAEEQEQKATAAKSQASSKKSAKSSGKPSSRSDDPRRYPSKDRIGGLDGITGGFAGGERGLQQFVEKGDLTFAEENSRKQTSPVAIAGLLGLAATAGGILLTDSIDLGESFLSGKIPNGLPTGKLDSTTRLALEVALGLLGLTAFLAGGRALVLRLSTAIQARTASVSRALIVLIFAIGVVAAARYILETS